MKTYEILVDGRQADDFVRGRISGIIYALTDTHQEGEVWEVAEEHAEWTMSFDATEEQQMAITEMLNRCHSNAFVGIREIG